MPPHPRGLALGGHGGAEDVGQAVDVGLGALLGDGDEQAVGVLVVLAAEREARVDAGVLAAGDDAIDRRLQAHGELAHHRLLVQRLDAVERRQCLARVVRALQQQLAELDEPAAAQPGQVDDAGQRVERLGGADVRGRLLAADVLLARLQREHEAAAPVDVARLARDPPGHAPQVGLGGGEEAERRAAEVQAVAERLALPDGDVDAALARRLEDPERDRVVGADDDRGRVLGGARQRGGVLDGAEEVGLLEDDRARVLVDGGGPGVGVGDAVAQADLDDLVAVAGGERAQRRARVRVHAARDDDPRLAVGELGQVGGGRDGARALVDARVGDRQRRQLGDRRLVLEHHLQPALGDLGLVGRVGRQELRAPHEHVDDRRDVVVVHAGAEEGDLVLGARVGRGQRAQVRVDVLLGHAGGQVERALQAHGGRDLAIEELLERADADLGQHRLEVLGGCRRVGAQLRTGSWSTRRRRAGRRARRGPTA